MGFGYVLELFERMVRQRMGTLHLGTIGSDNARFILRYSCWNPARGKVVEVLADEQSENSLGKDR